LEVDVAGRRCLHCRDESRAGQIALQPPKFFGGDDDDLITSVNSDVLRTFGAHAAHEFAKARFRILQYPTAGTPIALAAAR
jgi:hypothetical protein